MEIPIKKIKSGFKMPIFGIGTWRMGGDFLYNRRNDDEADKQALRNALNSGITHIDTAERYAEGHAEELVGQVIKDYDRKRIFLVSKVWDNHLEFESVLAAFNNSLKRLKTDYLDLYLIHKPNPQIPIKDTMKAMNKLKKEGLIKNIGVSNFSVARFKEAQIYADYKIVANQVHYNLIFREADMKGVLDLCQANEVMLIAWRPVEKGIFGKKSFKVLAELSKKYNKSPIQIAINWLISQKNVVTISKMRNPQHLKENLGALGWFMRQEDVKLLQREFPDQRDISDAVPII